MMGEAYKYVAPVASTLGVSVTDLNVAIGILGDNGIKASSAGNQLKNGLTNLNKASGEVGKAMKKYGIELKKNKDGSVNLNATIKDMKTKLDKLNKSQKAQALTSIFGKQNMAGWAAIVNTSTDRIDELTDAIENSTGCASDMAKVMGDNLSGSVKSMKSAFEGVMITVGDMFIPIAKKVVDSVTGMLRKFNEMDSGTQKLIVAIGGAVAVIGPLMMAIGGIGGAIMKVMPLISGIASGMGLTLTASTALIGGLTALGVALLGLGAYVGSNSDMLTALQDRYGIFGQALGSVCEFIYGTFKLTFGNIGILISTIGKSIMALMKGDFKEAGNIFSEGMSEMATNTTKAMRSITGGTSWGIKMMKDMSASEMQGVEQVFNNSMKNIKGVTVDGAKESASKMLEEWKNMDDKTLSIMQNTTDSTALLFKGITKHMTEDEAMAIFEANIKRMAKTGETSIDKIEKDTASFSNMLEKNLKTGSHQVEKAGEEIWSNFKNVSSRGLDSVCDSIASDLKKMDADTVSALQATGGSLGQFLSGITDIANTSSEDLATALKQNYTDMGMTSDEIMKAMEQDLQMYIKTQTLASANLSDNARQMVNEASSICDSMSNVTKENVESVADSLLATIGDMEVGTLTKFQEMDNGIGLVLKGLEEGTDMSSKKMKEILISNITAMLEQGVPITEVMKSDVLSLMEEMADSAEGSTEGMSSSVVDLLGNMSNGVVESISEVPGVVEGEMAEASAKASEGANNVKESMTNGTEGTKEAVKENIDMRCAVEEEVSEATISAKEATAIKNELLNAFNNLTPEAQAQLGALPDAINTSIVEGKTSASEAQAIKAEILRGINGVADGVKINMNGVSNAVQSETNKAVQSASNNSQKITSEINSKTANAGAIAQKNMAGVSNAVTQSTQNASKVAGQGAQNISKNVDKGTKDVSKVAQKNMKDVEKNVKNSMSNASKTARQEATNMYNGVKTSFNSMQSQGTNAVNTLKNNVINSTAIMKNSAIKFWSEIRSEYAKTITGKIEVTKTIKENKIVTTTTVSNDSGKKSAVSRMIDAIAIDETDSIRREASETLSRFRSNDTISVVEEKKKGKEEEKNVASNNTSNTYITNNYTSPKATSLLELKRQSKRESRKLGATLR